MKILNIFITAFCSALLAYDWYSGVQVPAWIAMLWCLATFFHELHDWLVSRYAD